MNILIAGASGFIGRKLIETLLLHEEYCVRTLSRFPDKLKEKLPPSVECYSWNPDSFEVDCQAFLGVDVVINLAGENISDARWTIERKKKIVNSRINGTKLLINEISKLNKAPRKFISASAIGFYGDRGNEVLDEKSSKGTGFLSDLCELWEQQVFNHNVSNMDVSAIRTGVVLGQNGGVLEKLLTPFKLGLGAKIGSGRQFMSWIHIDDLIGIFEFLINSKKIEGIYNATTSNPKTNKEFSQTLGDVLHRPVLFSIPSFVLKFALGELSDVLLEGQFVLPSRLLKEKFEFKYSDLQQALNSIC